jgi:hypothetical protein
MLPMATMLFTSVLVPMILTLTWVPGSIVMSALFVNCGGVALASYVISSGINYASAVSATCPLGASGSRQWPCMRRHTCEDTNSGSGPALAKKPWGLTELTIASTCRRRH